MAGQVSMQQQRDQQVLANLDCPEGPAQACSVILWQQHSDMLCDDSVRYQCTAAIRTL